VSRPTLATRTRTALITAADALETRPKRFIVLGGLLVLVLGLHWWLGDPRIAWLTAPIALLAGLAGGVRSALVVASIGAVGHLAIDLLIGVTGRDVLGLVVRTLVLPGLALVGTAGQHVERQRDRAMQRAVSEDPVTGLLNVRAFYEELHGLRMRDEPFTILLADIRGMRALNERYGHPTGTEAMRALAQVLRRCTGPEALTSRLGSDEVAVALVGVQRDRCQSVVDDVVARLHEEQVPLPDGERFEVHAAYGIARFPEDGDDEVAVLRAADRAKERAKAAGMDRVGLAEGGVA
jgi:diguanylate cyclase (GGDEF)-like protein